MVEKGSNNNLQASDMDKDPLVEKLKSHDYALMNLARSAAYKNENEDKDSTINIALIGLEDGSKAGPDLIDGRKIEENSEIIASQSLRDVEGLNLGDKIKLSANDRVYEIVGFTKDLKYNVSPVVYTKLAEASSAAMIYQADSESSATAAEIPERVSGALILDDKPVDIDGPYETIAISDFIKELPGYTAQLLTFGLMIGFLIVIAAIVLGVFLYIITIQKAETFGVMKVQGISNAYIGRSVIVQTLIVSLTGLILGLALSYLTEYFLPAAVPFRSKPTYYLAISLAIILSSQLGALFSVRSVAKVDPLDVI